MSSSRPTIAGHFFRVDLVGAGFMGRGGARQVCRHVPGRKLVALASGKLAQVRGAHDEAGVLAARKV